jgi:ribonuclease HI
MELLAVIKAVEFTIENHLNSSYTIYTDSQYVALIPKRKEKLKQKNFLTNKGTPIQNSDLVKTLISQIENNSIKFVKIKAHQHSDKNNFSTSIIFNNEVDFIVRQLMRTAVDKLKGNNIEK